MPRPKQLISKRKPATLLLVNEHNSWVVLSYAEEALEGPSTVYANRTRPSYTSAVLYTQMATTTVQQSSEATIAFRQGRAYPNRVQDRVLPEGVVIRPKILVRRVGAQPTTCA